MSVKSLILGLSLVFGAGTAMAQGFAGLGQTTEGFALPDPDTRFVYPDDHGSHPEFRIEWWYITANLEDVEGTPYGVQWTLFRSALAPGGAEEDQAWMAHAAVSTPEGHRFAERFARGGAGTVGVTAEPYDAFLDEWRLAGPTLNEVRMTAQGSDFHYDLALNADRPFVAQGAEGYSVKSEAGQASHYYSQPFYKVNGTITLPEGSVQVTGKAWLDREWSSQPLTESQTGWDWVSLHFRTGEKLMGYRLRDTDGGDYTVGTWIRPDGTPEPLSPGALTMTPVDWSDTQGGKVPTTWQVTLPAKSLDLRVTAIYPDSWMGTLVSYWEGPVEVTGSHPGIGYLEMSGY